MGSRCGASWVELIKDSRFEGRALGLIRNAREQIWVGSFLFKGGGYRRSAPAILLRALIRAHNRGVRVLILLERPDDPLSEVAIENAKTARLFTQAGIPVYVDSPQRRSHLKIIVVDARYVLVGSHNLTQSALRYNHELSVLLDSPCVAKKAMDYLKGILKESSRFR